MVIVVLDEASDLGFEVTGKIVVLEQDAVLERLMLELDLTLSLQVTGRATDVIHAVVVEPFDDNGRDVAQAVIAQQARFMDDAELAAASRGQR